MIDARELRLGDVLRLRKQHPCGSREWAVVRVGAAIGLRCERCQRRVLLDRPVVERRALDLVSRGEGPTAAEMLERIGESAGTPDPVETQASADA